MAYAKVQWCDDAFIKDTSVVDVNADAKIIGLAIVEAQELYLKKALGTALYEAINTKITNSTLTGVYLTLMEKYILDTLKNYTLYLLAPAMVFKWRNTSIGSQSAENFVPMGMSDVVKYQSQFLTKAESYKQELNDYLIANYNDYPELAQNNTYDKKNADGIGFTVPMHLGSDYIQDRLNDKFFA